jgi:TonB-linked SusC/RagA family outer membrane protein
MRRSLLLLLALIALPAQAWAQGTIRGVVTDEAGSPLPGANVAILQTTFGTATAPDGTYRLDGVPAGRQLVAASFVGFNTQQQEVNVVAGQTTTVNFRLTTGVTLQGITVDALGFATDADRLGTSQTTVGGESIVRSGETNILRGLAAKSPGLNITAAGGDPGSSTRILIRGQTTIQGNNQPLVIIDGVPVSNASLGGGVAGVQQQSRLNDLNPDDIESVEVLRSASAAALWGSRAQSGVIVITTKTGRARQRANVSVRSTVSVDEVNRVAPLQSEFGGGNNGLYQFNSTGGRNWGDRIADRPGGQDVFSGDAEAVGRQTGTVYRTIANGTADNPHGGKRSQEVYDINDLLFGNGIFLDNTASISAGDAQSRYYLSIGHLNQDGVIQGNSNYDRTSIRLNADRQFSPVFGVQGSANYIRSASDRIQQGSNLAGLLLGGWRQRPDFDAQDYIVDYFPSGQAAFAAGTGLRLEGRHRSYRNPLGASADPIYDNPLWTMNRHVNGALVNRMQGRVGATYDPMAWLNFTANVGADFYADRRETFLPVFTGGTATGSRVEDSISEFQITGTLTGRATRDLTPDIGGSALVGLNLSHREFDSLQGSLIGLINPGDFRSLSNAEASNRLAGQSQSVQRTLGTFAELDFDLYDQLFVKLTGRLDNASTFGPEASNTFFYPSVSAAWQFNQLLTGFEPLSFGKLRASYGVVGREPTPYGAFTYITSASVGDGYTDFSILSGGNYGGAFSRSRLQGNPIVVPERKAEFEVGADLRFLQDRVTLGATYYDNTTTDAIFNLSVPPSTGFTVQNANAAIIDNHGIELSSEFQWPQVGPFGWTTYASWWQNRNTVRSLAGVQETSLAGFIGSTSSLVEGQPFGVLFGTRWRRAPEGCTEQTVVQDCDPISAEEQALGYRIGNEGLVLDDLGFPVTATTPGVLGDPNPDWRAAIGNTFRIADFSANVLFDFSMGGDVWNGTKGALIFFGTAAETADWTTVSAEQANAARNIFGETLAEMAEYHGTVRRNADGTYSFRGRIDDFGGGPVLLEEYWYRIGPGSGFTGPTEQFIEDGSFVRLREVTLSYNWRDRTVQRLGLGSIELSLTGRNLHTWTDYRGIDPETNLTGPTNGQGLDYFNNPFTRSYQFSVRFNY